jgi:hypothetical protein
LVSSLTSAVLKNKKAVIQIKLLSHLEPGAGFVLKYVTSPGGGPSAGRPTLLFSFRFASPLKTKASLDVHGPKLHRHPASLLQHKPWQLPQMFDLLDDKELLVRNY